MFRGIWAKMVLEVCFDLKKYAHEKKNSVFFLILEVISFGFFSGKLREIWAKILLTPKTLPAPTPMAAPAR